MKLLRISAKNGQDYIINTSHISMLSTNKRASIGDKPKEHVTIHLLSGARIDLSDIDINYIEAVWTNTTKPDSKPS